MSIAPMFHFVIGLLASATMCGAWWYAALQKRKVAIFYWLAAAHTLSFAVQVLSITYYTSHVQVSRLAAVGSMQMLMSFVLAGLYVALVRWLVDQP